MACTNFSIIMLVITVHLHMVAWYTLLSSFIDAAIDYVSHTSLPLTWPWLVCSLHHGVNSSTACAKLVRVPHLTTVQEQSHVQSFSEKTASINFHTKRHRLDLQTKHPNCNMRQCIISSFRQGSLPSTKPATYDNASIRILDKAHC